jgi:hypothetical protein
LTRAGVTAAELFESVEGVLPDIVDLHPGRRAPVEQERIQPLRIYDRIAAEGGEVNLQPEKLLEGEVYILRAEIAENG